MCRTPRAEIILKFGENEPNGEVNLTTNRSEEMTLPLLCAEGREVPPWALSLGQ